MPLAWLVFSLWYLIFAFSIEARRMPADREGWDPGSNAVPVGLGIIMVVVSLYLVLSDRGTLRTNQPAAEVAGPATPVSSRETDGNDRALRRLTVLTLVVTAIYILIFRWSGFVLSTTALMVTLTFFFSRGDTHLADLPRFGMTLGATALVTVALYSLGRWIIRWTQYYGRTLDIELFRNRLFTALLALAAWALVVAPAMAIARRRGVRFNRPGTRAAVVSAVTTLGLYLVFQQIFRVALPGGWVAW